MVRAIPDAALDLLCRFEGFRAEPYYDIAGILTIGYGHRIRPGEKFDTITEAQGRELLRRDALATAVCVEKWVHPALTDNQYGALVCFAFNVGVGVFLKSALLADLNKGNYAVVTAHLLSYDHAHEHGELVEVEGLKRRREAEAALWAA